MALITRREAICYLAISKASFYRFIQGGFIAPSKDGYFDTEDLDVFKSTHRINCAWTLKTATKEASKYRIRKDMKHHSGG